MSKHIFALLVSLVLLTGCVSNGNQNTCYPEISGQSHIFVATAFGMERQAVESRVDIISQCLEDEILYTVADLRGYEIVIFSTGVGPENAVNSTQKTIENFDVEAIVFSGIAGGIDESLAIGDTVVPTSWYDLGSGNVIDINDDFVQIAHGLTNVGIPESGVTSDVFVSNPETVEVIRTNFRGSVVDMESYWAAKVASENGVPFIAVRSVSDYADGEKDKSHYQEAAENSADVALRFVLMYFARQAP